MPRALLSVLLLLPSCAVNLGDLPLPPGAGVPVVSGFSPPSGVPTIRLTVRGSGFGPGAKVRFGDRGESTPVSVAEDGGSLEVLVPEDAATGPVSVLVDGKQGRSVESFVLNGLDRLKFGRAARSLDLPLPILRAFPRPDGNAFALLAGPPYNTVFTDGEPAPLPMSHVRELASARGGAVLVTWDAAMDCDSAGAVTVVTHPFTPERTIRRGCLNLPANVEYFELMGLAIDPDATRALVLSLSGAWIVALDETPRTLEVVLPPDESAWSAVTWLDGARFGVATNDARLARVDAAVNPALVETAPLPAVEGDDFVTALAADGKRLALGTAFGKFALFDVGTWPPESESAVDTGMTSAIFSFAFSGDRLSVVQARAAVVTTYGLDVKPPRALGGVEVMQPNGVATLPGGDFIVSHERGVLRISAHTGSHMNDRRVEALVQGPHLRSLPDGSGGTRDVLELASLALDRVVRYDPRTLQPEDGSDLAGSEAREPVSGIVTAPGTSVLVAQRGGFLTHVDAASGLVERPDRYALGSAGRVGWTLSTDGRALAVRIRDADGNLRAIFLDTAADWSATQPAPVGLDGDEIYQAECGETRCLLTGAVTLRLYDRAGLLSGVPSPPVGTVTFDEALVSASFTSVGVLVVTQAAVELVADDGSRVVLGRSPIVPGVSAVENRLSPGGRRLYWLEGLADSPRLVSFGLDLGLRQFVGLTDSVSLGLTRGNDSANRSSFSVAADGERVFTLLGLDERLVVVE